MMKNLYIDFDGVIYNSIEVSYKMAEEEKINKDYESYYQFFKNLDWCGVLEESIEINDAFNCIQKIIDCSRFNVFILTHVVSLKEAELKVKLIREHLEDVTIIPVPKKISKTKMVKVKDAILVDDYPENLREWKEAGGIGVRFDLDMDGKGFPVICKLDELIEMF